MNAKNDSFAREMAKIGHQAEAERLAELKAERRRAVWAKVRKVVLVVALLAVVYRREQIVAGVKQLTARTGLTGGSGQSLTGYGEANEKLRGNVQGIQAAAKRNQMVDDFTPK